MEWSKIADVAAGISGGMGAVGFIVFAILRITGLYSRLFLTKDIVEALKANNLPPDIINSPDQIEFILKTQYGISQQIIEQILVAETRSKEILPLLVSIGLIILAGIIVVISNGTDSGRSKASTSTTTKSFISSTSSTTTITIKEDSKSKDTTTTIPPMKHKSRLNVNIIYPLDNTIYNIGDRIDFSAASGEHLDYKWNFDDGEVATGPTPSHIYSDEGNYKVTLTATDKDRNVGTASVTVRIDNNFEIPNPDSFIKFVSIPAGEFNMGPRPDDKNEVRLHATMSAFEMQETEMTQGQWKMMMGSNPSHFKCGDECPVENVSWNDIQEVIRRLNRADERYKYDLPTEAQWEYACRAGSESKFCFGDDETELVNHAWYSGNARSKSHPVKQLSISPWHLYDMHGNVSEWCKDSGLNYSRDYGKDPIERVGEWAAIRGGNYFSPAPKCQSNWADSRINFEGNQRVGFRLVRIPK